LNGHVPLIELNGLAFGWIMELMGLAHFKSSLTMLTTVVRINNVLNRRRRSRILATGSLTNTVSKTIVRSEIERLRGWWSLSVHCHFLAHLQAYDIAALVAV
jgi:hypothetical protein